MTEVSQYSIVYLAGLLFLYLLKKYNVPGHKYLPFILADMYDYGDM